MTESIPSVRSISVGVWVFTGSRDESEEESGISHFIEHMVFKGTTRRKMHHIAQRMESVGGYLNAFTGKEYTCYYARALDEHLDRAVDVVSDLILQPLFPEKDLEKEKDVVIEEMKMYEDVPDDFIFDRFESALYPSHPMGRPVLGTPESVRSFSRDQLFRYLEARYTPDRIVLSAAGNISHERVVRLAEKAFGRTQRKGESAPRIPVNGYLPTHSVEDRSTQQAHLVLGTRTFDVHDERRIALSVLNTMLGGGMSSFLNQNIREKYGYCYNIYSFLNFHTDTGDFGIYMGMDESKVERARQLIFRELDRLTQRQVSPRKLHQAKNQVKGSIMLGLESMGSRMMRIGRQELYYEQYTTLDAVLEQVDQVTAEEVQAVAQALFVRDDFSSIVFLPQP